MGKRKRRKKDPYLQQFEDKRLKAEQEATISALLPNMPDWMTAWMLAHVNAAKKLSQVPVVSSTAKQNGKKALYDEWLKNYKLLHDSTLGTPKAVEVDHPYPDQSVTVFEFPVEPVDPTWADSEAVLLDAFPALKTHMTWCPVDSCQFSKANAGHPTMGMRYGAMLFNIITHLNDVHRWPRTMEDTQDYPGVTTRHNIADWLEELAIRDGIDLTFKMADDDA